MKGKAPYKTAGCSPYFISNRVGPGVSFLYCFLIGDAYYIRYMKKFTFLFLIYTFCFMSYNEYTDCVDA